MPNYAGLGPADFEEAIAQKLLPPGLAWTRLLGSTLQRYWRAAADAVAAVHARAGVLTEREAFPPASLELLPDWERALGLPDPCLPANSNTAARQAAVRARLAETGGQSIPYYQEVAANLGTSIVVTEYAPFRWGIDHWGPVDGRTFTPFVWGGSVWGGPLWTVTTGPRVGGELRCPAWANVWLVTLTDGATFHFEWGVSHWAEPFWSIADEPIICELLRLKPAHTHLLFVEP